MNKIKVFIEQCLWVLTYLVKLPSYKFHKIKGINKYSGRINVLVNGPSLKDTFQAYDRGEVKLDQNSFMVNLSALDERFMKIKPMFYCLSDPIFYQDYEPKKEQVKKMYRIFNEQVDWDMNLYLCFGKEYEYDKFEKYANITNPHVTLVRMNRKYCSRLKPSLRHKLYKTGYFMPEDGTIANTAIYLSLLFGYKTIMLYGADHNMFLELAVNDQNQLCSLDSHFYDKEKPKMKPFLNTCVDYGVPFRVHGFMYILYVMFNSHNLLRQFANYMGARIINCTPNSMIDSYERLVTLSPDDPVFNKK